MFTSCLNEKDPQKKVQNEFLKLDDNGITIKASDYAKVDAIYELNGVSYKVVDVAYLRRAMASGDDVTHFVTSKVTNMNRLFYGNDGFNQDISSWDVNNVKQYYNFSLFSTLWTERKKPKFTNCSE